MLDALAALAKAVLYAGLLSAAGIAFAQVTLALPPAAAGAAEQLMRRAGIAAISAALAGAVILTLRLGGQLDGATISAVFLSGAGAAIGLQLAGCLLLLSTGGSDASARATRAADGAIALASFAVSGHAATLGLTEGLATFLHGSAAAWWIGSLWLLRHACASWEAGAVALLVSDFARAATIIVGGLVIVGLALISILVDFSRDPWLAPYGRLLAIKLGAASLVLGVAIYNKYRLTPRLAAGDASAVAALRRTIGIELGLIALVLIATALLTTYTSPHD